MADAAPVARQALVAVERGRAVVAVERKHEDAEDVT